MKYTQIPANTFKEIQLNSGIILSNFNPATAAVNRSDILGATSGNINFSATPTYEDFGEDINNCPKDTKELKKLTDIAVTLSGTFVTVTPGLSKMLVGAADVDESDSNHIIPRRDLDSGDFSTLWWVGDYSDKNGTNNGGFVAIKMYNTLSTGGFQIQSTDKAKGTFAFTFTAHFSINSPDTVPYEIYVKAGTSESGDYEMALSSAAGSTTGYTAITAGASASSGQTYVYQTGVDLYIPSKGSVLTGSAWTSWDGDDEIASTTGLDIIVAIRDSENKAVRAGKTTVIVKES